MKITDIDEKIHKIDKEIPQVLVEKMKMTLINRKNAKQSRNKAQLTSSIKY